MQNRAESRKKSKIQNPKSKILIAGYGNVLWGDDGFGVAVAQKLAARDNLPAGVKVVEVGIGGMALLYELYDRYDALIIVDATDRGGAPGTTYLLEVEVPDAGRLSEGGQQDFMVDMHLATPARGLLLAGALGLLPPVVYMLGCQPVAYEELVMEMSEPVLLAVEESVERILAEVARLAERPVEAGK